MCTTTIDDIKTNKWIVLWKHKVGGLNLFWRGQKMLDLIFKASSEGWVGINSAKRRHTPYSFLKWTLYADCSTLWSLKISYSYTLITLLKSISPIKCFPSTFSPVLISFLFQSLNLWNYSAKLCLIPKVIFGLNH